MRKILWMLLAALLLLSGCGKKEALENPYRLKTQILESYRDGGVRLVRSENTYDENNCVTEQQTFHDEQWHSTFEYTWDDYGNIISLHQTYANGTESLREETLTLDDQHRVIHSETDWEDGRHMIAEYSYNADGQTTREYIHRPGFLDGEDWNSYVDRTYDRHGNLIREDCRWEPGNNSSYTLYSYEKDRLLREEYIVGEELESYTEYTYEENGLIQTAIAYKADGTLHDKHVSTFDEYGNTLEVVAFAYASEQARFGKTDEEPDSRTTYVYELKN